MDVKNVERSIKQCPRCLGEKKIEGEDCPLCKGTGGVESISIGDNEIVVQDKARFVG